MKVETDSLQTVKNYALQYHVTPSYIYKLIRENKMQSILIDGVQFIDMNKNLKLPTRK
jgi:hypothetical protein